MQRMPPRSVETVQSQAQRVEVADVRRLATPIPYRGALGLWRVPDEVQARIQEAL